MKQFCLLQALCKINLSQLSSESRGYNIYFIVLCCVFLFISFRVPEELLSFMGVMYPSSSVSPLDILSPRKMVGSALYLCPTLSSPPVWLRLFLCRLPLQRWSSWAAPGPPAASWFTQAWAPATELSTGFGTPSRYPNWFWGNRWVVGRNKKNAIGCY